MNALFPNPALLSELSLRHRRLQDALLKTGADAMLFSANVSLYYVSGQVYRGWFYLPAEGSPVYFMKRPIGLQGETLHYIQHPREIPERLRELGISTPGKLLIEGETSYEEWMQWKEWFPHTVLDNATRVLRKVRAVKLLGNSNKSSNQLDYIPLDINRFRHCTVLV